MPVDESVLAVKRRGRAEHVADVAAYLKDGVLPTVACFAAVTREATNNPAKHRKSLNTGQRPTILQKAVLSVAQTEGDKPFGNTWMCERYEQFSELTSLVMASVDAQLVPPEPTETVETQPTLIDLLQFAARS